MSSSNNPSVRITSIDDEVVAGYQGGRPPDEVKRGRSTDVEMLIDANPCDGVNGSSGLEGDVQSPVVSVGTLNQKSTTPSFKDKLLGAKGASHHPCNITELDVEVREEDVGIGCS
ncbi:hypothetical protein V6N13_148251 [Hibiscus sabdariffa]